MWRQVEALDNQVDDALQSAMLNHLKTQSIRATNWFLHSKRLAEPMQPLITRLQPAVAALRERLLQAAAAAPLAVLWQQGGVPAALAQSVAMMEGLYDALDIADIAELTQHSLDDVSKLHFDLGSRLGLQPLQQQIDTLPSGGYWDNLAKIALSDDLAGLQRAIALEVLGQGGAAPALQQWEEDNRLEIDSARKLLAELADARSPDLAMLSVALRKLRNLA